MMLYFLCQFVLINYISPLLDENYLSEIWSDGVGYAISVTIYVIFCLVLSMTLIFCKFTSCEHGCLD